MSTVLTVPQTVPAGVIQRYTFHERMCHWMTAATYTYCLATGLAFFTPHLFWIAIVLGGGPTSRFWHPILGLAFAVCAFWMHELWRREMNFSEADQRWLHRVKYYVTNQDQLVPPQERFNAGQKQFYWLMFYGALALLLSGIFLWFPEYIPLRVAWIRRVMVLLHEVAALATIAGFIIHVYMSVFFVPGSVTAMVTGHVSRAWARSHHLLWYLRITGQTAPKE